MRLLSLKKDKIKIILVRPPRYMWPVINESDNFLLPLGLPCIAACVRQEFKNMEIKIIDCPPLKIGWHSLVNILRYENPDVIGAGEEALYHHEAVRLFSLAKEINPGIITIAGGHFFSWMPDYSLQRYPIDYIVRFEGEITIVELLRALRGEKVLSDVEGIAFRENGKIIKTPPRPLIDDLDTLPLPAFDLMPMGNYAPFGYLWPLSVTLEHSRGCIDQCSFCSLWSFWGDQSLKDSPLLTKNRYRTKSVERAIEEVEICYHKHKRKYVIWADPTFNADSKWTEHFCDELMKRNFRDLHWWAFLRADCMVRDEKLGILEKMVKAGLVHPLIGIERAQNADLKQLNKHGYNQTLIEKAYAILKSKYPHVFRQGTFITCLRADTKESMFELVDYAIKLDVDYPAFHPLAPVPGTILYEEAKTKGWIEVVDFRRYDWYTPIMSSETLTREELAALNIELNKRFILRRPLWAIRGFFGKGKHRRRLYWWFFRVTLMMLLLEIKDQLLHRTKFEGITGFMHLRKPKWYDS